MREREKERVRERDTERERDREREREKNNMIGFHVRDQTGTQYDNDKIK